MYSTTGFRVKNALYGNRWGLGSHHHGSDRHLGKQSVYNARVICRIGCPLWQKNMNHNNNTNDHNNNNNNSSSSNNSNTNNSNNKTTTTTTKTTTTTQQQQQQQQTLAHAEDRS